MGDSMKWFNLKIKEYINSLLDEQGISLRSIAAIKYPIYFVESTIKKYAADDEHSLDHKILKIVDHFKVTDINTVNLVLGVMERVISWRIDILVDIGYLIVSNNKIELTEEGSELLKKEDSRIIITTTENFYIDGITLKPLPLEFYEVHRKYGSVHTFINHSDSDFEPNHFHTPPDDRIGKNIIDIPVNERSSYSIPEGLIEVIDIHDPLRMIHPLGLVFSSNDQGVISKKFVDCCDSFANDTFLSEENKNLGNRINDLFIKTGMNRKRMVFTTNWDTEEKYESNVVSNLKKEKIGEMISKKIEIDLYDFDDLEISADKIEWKIDKKYFSSDNRNRKKLFNYLLDGYVWILQHPSTGVWLVLIDFIPNDQYVKDLLKLSNIIENDKYDFDELINNFGMIYLRELLISIEKYFILEDLETFYYLSDFENNKYMESKFNKVNQN